LATIRNTLFGQKINKIDLNPIMSEGVAYLAKGQWPKLK
jgi:hypothetical protein